MEKINMRRIPTALVLVFALIMTAALSGCTGFGDADTVDGLEIYYSRFRGECFAGKYIWDGGSTDIYIPDEHMGLPVTRIGGYMGTGCPVHFLVDLGVLGNCSDIESYLWNNYFPNGEPPVTSGSEHRYTYIDLSSSDLAVELRRETVTFTLHIGRNVNEFGMELLPLDAFLVNDDGSVTVFSADYRFECSPENATFFSENGMIFRKDTGEAVFGGRKDNLSNDMIVYFDRITPPDEIVVTSPCDVPSSLDAKGYSGYFASAQTTED